MGFSCLNVNHKTTVMKQENCHTDFFLVSSLVMHFFTVFWVDLLTFYRLVTMDEYFSLLRY